MKTLSDICEVYSGYALKEFNDQNIGLPVIKIGNILNDGTLALEECQYTSENVNEKYYSKKGDIYVALSGATTGKIGLLESDERHVINQRVGVVRRKNDEVPQQFVKYFLMRQTDRILQEASGCAQPNISPKQIAQYEVPKLSKTKMEEISNILDKLSNVIKQRKEELQKLDELIKARFVELFGDPVSNSKCFTKEELGKVCTNITDGTHDTPERYPEGYLLITGKNIRASGIIYDDVEYVSEEDHKVIYARCNPEYEDVLYTNIGVNYGTACLNNLQYEFSMKNVALLKPDRNRINGYYLWICLNLMRDHILLMNQVGGAQTFMGLASIKKIVIPIPPIELQNGFIDDIKQVDKSKVAIQKTLGETQLLFDSLMQEYFG